MAILNKIKTKKDKTPTSIDKNISKHDEARVNPHSHQRQSALLVKQPWVTEKAGDLAALRKYVFIVDRKTNKSEAKRAIESIYGVKVENVNIINMKGKAKRLGRSLGKTSAHKKIIATLKEGQKIDIIPT